MQYDGLLDVIRWQWEINLKLDLECRHNISSRTQRPIDVAVQSSGQERQVYRLDSYYHCM